MQHPVFVSVLVFVMAAVVLLQAVLLALAVGRILQSLQRVNEAIERLSKKSDETLQFTYRVLSRAEEFCVKLPELQRVIGVRLDSLVELTRSTNQVVADRMEGLRSHLREVENGIDSALGKFAQQVYRVHRSLRDPSMRLSAVFRSVAAVLGQVVSKGDGSPEPRSADEELFI